MSSFWSHIASSFWTSGFFFVSGIATGVGVVIGMSPSLRSRGAPQLYRIGESAGLLADRRHLAGVFRVLERGVRDLVLRENVLEHRPLEQRRVAERRRGEHHALRAGRTHLLHQELALVLAPVVVLGRRGRGV